MLLVALLLGLLPFELLLLGILQLMLLMLGVVASGAAASGGAVV